MFSHIEYGGTHGMVQGIWPRFYLQMLDLAELAIGKDAFHAQFNGFEKTVFSDLTNLYDLYHEIMKLIDDYKSGMSNGKYYTQSIKGTPIINRESEERIKNRTADFIIRNKILLVNFYKCGVLNGESFDFNHYCVSDDKRQPRKEKYLKGQNQKFLPLITLLERANDEFIKDLMEVRNSFEHNSFTLDKFELILSDGSAQVREPVLAGEVLSKKLTLYYDKTLDFIERGIAYYFGILGEAKLPGFLELHEDTVFDYPKMNYRFRFALGGVPWSFTSKRCTYD